MTSRGLSPPGGRKSSPRAVSQRRGKKVADLLGRGGANAAEAEAQAEAVVE
jgi:small subunit ribosomal protein S5